MPSRSQPRIACFKQQHPDIELRVITTDTDLDLARERVDLAITLGADGFANYQRWHFVDEEIFPVCSPKFLQANPLPDLSALAHSPLLLLEERYKARMGWRHIVQPVIAQGLLVRPLQQSVGTDQPLYITAPQGKVLRPDVAYLKDWLVAEAANT
jgi:DNA-binding transcriptional LysR family regulator